MASSVRREARVDFAHTYYLNSKLPWFGSASATAELDKDGSLSKGTVEAESKADLALGFLPIKEVLSAKWLPSSTSAGMTTAATVGIERVDKDLPKEVAESIRRLQIEQIQEKLAPTGYELEIVPAGYQWVETLEWPLGQQQSSSGSLNSDGSNSSNEKEGGSKSSVANKSDGSNPSDQNEDVSNSSVASNGNSTPTTPKDSGSADGASGCSEPSKSAQRTTMRRLLYASAGEGEKASMDELKFSGTVTLPKPKTEPK